MSHCVVTREAAAAWATLASLRLPINPQDVVEILGDPCALFSSTVRELKARLPWTEKQLKRVGGVGSIEPILAHMDRLATQQVRVISYPDAAYPERLRQISCPPAALWCWGSAASLSRPAVAIVGARRASAYGSRVAMELATGLVQAGVVVVSGGAVGIDAAAHRGALDAGGATVAVFGTGIDQIYPATHRDLFRRVGVEGACVTEFAPGVRPRPSHFPVRNRVISGLCLGVIVVEAAERSGALITARFATEQNREVFAVPGNVHSPLSFGPHQLLRLGARLVADISDVVEELKYVLPEESADGGSGMRVGMGVQPSTEPPVGVSALGGQVWRVLSGEPISIDGILGKVKASPGDILEVLTELELMGAVSQHPGQRFVRRDSSLG